jgi:ferritin-like metal-binding protein YciE
MNNNKRALIEWLRNAHAMERTSVDNLDRLADRFSRHPEIAIRFREHWRDSLNQVVALEVCLKKLGADASTFKDLANRFVGIAQAYAGIISLDEPVKDCLAAYASAHLEIATYISLQAAAQELSEPDIARMCDEHLQRERAMAGWLEQQITEVTLSHLRP